jgi:hypothetical protein
MGEVSKPDCDFDQELTVVRSPHLICLLKANSDIVSVIL